MKREFPCAPPSDASSASSPRGPALSQPSARRSPAPTRPVRSTRSRGTTARWCRSSCCRSTTSTATSAPPSGSSGRNVIGHEIDPETGLPKDTTADAGGVEYLATHLAQARKGHRNSLTVAAGDIIGASPLLSAAFHDEPTIESMNKLGLDVTSVGNHEFDEGYKELQRMAFGGCIDDGAGREQPELLRCPHVPRRRLRLPRSQRPLRRHEARRSSRRTPSRRCTARRSASSA